jgi:transposase-like protein
MSDRFYNQMLEATGWCPGFKNTRTLEEYENKYGKTTRRRKMAWTDEAKAQAVEMYTAEEATPENSMEIVKEIAAELGESPNGVRMILTRAGVYVKKTPAAKSTSSGTSGGGGGRVSVADAQQAVTDAISDAGMTADAAIISKLTGKAANYFAEVITKLNG